MARLMLGTAASLVPIPIVVVDTLARQHRCDVWRDSGMTPTLVGGICMLRLADGMSSPADSYRVVCR